MRNISVKLFLIRTSSSGDVIKRHFLSRALAAPLFVCFVALRPKSAAIMVMV